MSRNSKVNQVILILMDDVRSSHFFGLLNKGKLPNIERLAKDGISCQNCITSYPAITFPCYSNVIIGSYSGYYKKEGSGVPMYHWVSRNDPPSEGGKYPVIRSYNSARNIRKLNSDIGENVKTIFEQAGEGNFVSSLNLIYRGSQFLTLKEFTSASILKSLETVFKKPQDFFPDKEVPKVSVAYVPATDDLMHNKGFDHPDYSQEIINCDNYIGSLINTLRDLGFYDDTAIGIISDHGNYKVEKLYDLEPFFNQIGLNQYQPKKGIGDFDATMGSVGFFNFPGDDWHHHPTFKQLCEFNPSGVGKQNIDIFKMLWKIPGVKFMYYRDDNNTPDKGIIHIEYRETNSSEIYKGQIEYDGHGKEQRTKYVFNEREFYGYEKSEISTNLLDSKSHTIEEWLKGTNQIDFPMIIDQIPRYFKNPRSCDILISTLGEYGFNYEHGKTANDHVYSHDIALKKSMTVPLIVGGSPEIPSNKIRYCKTTDLVPTLLNLLGVKPHWTVVGRSLVN